MSAPIFQMRSKAFWMFLHVCTLAIPACALFWGAKWLDIFLPVCSNLVVNFAPSLMLNKVIKPNLNLAKDYAEAATQAAMNRNASVSECESAAVMARSKHENEQEIVGHLCITIIAIFGLLSSAAVLNFALMIPPPAGTVLASNTAQISTNLVNAVPQFPPPTAAIAQPARRIVAIVTVGITLLFSLSVLFYMATRTDTFVGKKRYLRQDVVDYVPWIYPSSIQCPMTYCRLVMAVLNSFLPVVKYWMN